MDLASTFPEAVALCPAWVPGQDGAGSRLQILDPEHAQRPSLQRFIAQTYQIAYGAQIEHFAQQLVGLRRPDGAWTAGVGYTLAGSDPLFIEQYLDRPVEMEIAARLGASIRRDQVVEVSNLAAPGSARKLIVCMTALLHHLRRTWVVFTSTRSLQNSFQRLEIAPIVLARADPCRLPDLGRSWGSYYATDPQVMTANIPVGFVHLLSRAAARRTI